MTMKSIPRSKHLFFHSKLLLFLQVWYTTPQLSLTPVQLLDVDSFLEAIHRIHASHNDYFLIIVQISHAVCHEADKSAPINQWTRTVSKLYLRAKLWIIIPTVSLVSCYFQRVLNNRSRKRFLFTTTEIISNSKHFLPQYWRQQLVCHIAVTCLICNV